jgi:CheY-like chemotaxis protein
VPAAEIDALRAELRGMRELQQEILEAVQGVAALLRSRPAAAPPSRTERADEPSGGSPDGGSPDGGFPDFEEPEAAATAPRTIRTRQRQKSVLLIDDDEAACGEVQAALYNTQVPVRTVADGNSAIAAIAEEKPDVIVLELGLSGDMPGRDVINMIKATMEWVDIPIILYTQVPIDEKEARQIHGADRYVPKGPNSALALVNTVIRLFQTG